jgi:hypothetical protein
MRRRWGTETRGSCGRRLARAAAPWRRRRRRFRGRGPQGWAPSLPWWTECAVEVGVGVRVVGKALVSPERELSTFNVSYTLTHLQWRRASVQVKAIRQNRSKIHGAKCVASSDSCVCHVCSRGVVAFLAMQKPRRANQSNMTSPHPSKSPDRRPCSSSPSPDRHTPSARAGPCI